MRRSELRIVVVGLMLGACGAAGNWYLASRPSPQQAPSRTLELRERDSSRTRRALELRERLRRTAPHLTAPPPRLIDTHPLQHLRGSPVWETVPSPYR